jgi:hypothetical protein
MTQSRKLIGRHCNGCSLACPHPAPMQHRLAGVGEGLVMAASASKLLFVSAKLGR